VTRCTCLSVHVPVPYTRIRKKKKSWLLETQCLKPRLPSFGLCGGGGGGGSAIVVAAVVVVEPDAPDDADVVVVSVDVSIICC